MSSTTTTPRPTIAQRTVSIDSSVSTVSTSSTPMRSSPGSTMRTTPDPSPMTAATLIASTGSVEAALHKALAERQQLTSHNAQLWRLVEKQRSMLLGLGKDLEKMTKEKERYKRRLKEHLAQSGSISSIPSMQSSRLDENATREGSESPVLEGLTGALAPKPLKVRDVSRELRQQADVADGGSSSAGRSDTPQDTVRSMSSGLPGTPQSTNSLLPGVHDSEPSYSAAPPLMPAPLDIRTDADSLRRAKPISSPTSPSNQQLGSSPVTGLSPREATNAVSSPKTRKAPPAPLNLGRRLETAEAAIIVDASDSDHDIDVEGARVGFQERGRRKTREEDDRIREQSRQEEEEHRSRSKKDKKSKSRAAEPPQPAPTATANVTNSTQGRAAADSREAGPIFQHMINPADVIRGRAVSDMQRSKAPPPSLLSPGLPMSPRPGDRPLGSPMPRAPNALINSMPMSPKAGLAGFPLSPRAPRQPLPMPPQTPSSISVPHLDRAMAYHQQTRPAQPPQTAPSQTQPPKSSLDATSDIARPSMSSDQNTPGEIFTGFVSDAYPGLLLPPNALPSIYVKTTSPRMKPSRQSFIAPRPGEDNPVFTLAVYERSANKQLWRVEKTFQSLANLDLQLKMVCTMLARLPEKSLFTGHAPSKIDARRQAIDQFIEKVLDSVYDERAAQIVCAFLSNDAFGAEPSEYFGAARTPTIAEQRSDSPVPKLRQNRSGYLTKRGKNFGGWKARYFVLDGPNLKYFEGPGGAQLGAIKLQNAQIGKQSTTSASTSEDEENQYRHAFLILEPKKKDSNSLVRHVLCAESDEERDAWVDSLLQYVDFKDDEEAYQPGRQAQMSKHEISGARSPRLQKSLNDLRSNPNFRGGQYSDMLAGEAPVMGPPLSPRFPEPASPAFDKLEHGGPSHPTISGPTNLTVIQNTEDWGMKPPPTPGPREKKRSVFALPFSNRGRSSSELGPGEKGAGTERAMASVRAVFGVELADAAEFSRPMGVNTELPAVVYRCIEYLTAKDAVAEEGIFRLSGSNNVIKFLRERFNTEGDVNLLEESNHDIHAVASLLKLYLRELPSSIVTRELHLEFLKALELQHEQKVIAVNVLVNKLPRANRALVEALAAFMLLIVENVAVNRMTVRNLGVVFSPTLNLPGPLISLLVEEKQRIFGEPIDEANSPIAATNSEPSAIPSELRSPRKQMFTDLPTPAYNQTHFQSFHNMADDATSSGPAFANHTGMIPVHPSYGAFHMAPQGEGGFGSLNDALRSPNPYGTGANNNLTVRETKALRRESGMLSMHPQFNLNGGAATGLNPKPSLPELREEQ